MSENALDTVSIVRMAHALTHMAAIMIVEICACCRPDPWNVRAPSSLGLLPILSEHAELGWIIQLLAK